MKHEYAFFIIVSSITILSLYIGIWTDSNSDGVTEDGSRQRRLQFDGMFDATAAVNGNVMRRKKGNGKLMDNNQSGMRGEAGVGGRLSRPQALSKYVDDVLLNSEMYNLWWSGPPESNMFKPAKWATATHTKGSNAIFTMAMVQGGNDAVICSSPNDFHLFLGTARKVFYEDIVMAVDEGLSDETKAIINRYNVIVYEVPKELCSRATDSIFCGSADERVPASVFRYYFYEKWSSNYLSASFIMLTDFRDVLFQSNPFTYKMDEWYPEYQLVLYQEFHPNMVINRCIFNARLMEECYGDNALRYLGNKIIISSGVALGTRNAVIAWSHHMTLQLQEASGRLVETRCTSGGIEHAFINWLTYNNKLRFILRTKVFSQGEGAVNSVGGLRPNTVEANITGEIKSFWKLLNNKRQILNWNGDVSPVVHQLDHFLDELTSIVDEEIKSKQLLLRALPLDRGWHAINASRCLWGC